MRGDGHLERREQHADDGEDRPQPTPRRAKPTE
jgi:hypothetical protein